MSRQGASQLLRRVLAALLFIAAAVSIGIAPPVWVGALIIAGGLIYGVWPKPKTMAGDLMLRRGPAVIGPDMLGFSLTALFAALPIWIGRGEATMSIHGSASMIWIMAAGSAVLLLVGASASCFRLRLGSDGVMLMRLRGERELRWPDIIGWTRWRRGLPGILRRLTLFLPTGPAGAVLLARDSTGLALHLSDGRVFRLPHEGFEHGEAQLLQALKAHGVRTLSVRASG